MKFSELDKSKVETLIINVLNDINNKKTEGELYRYTLQVVYYDDKIDCWVATISDSFEKIYYDNYGNVDYHDGDEDFSEVFLGKKGIFNYALNKVEEADLLEQKWLSFLQHSKQTTQEQSK